MRDVSHGVMRLPLNLADLLLHDVLLIGALHKPKLVIGGVVIGVVAVYRALHDGVKLFLRDPQRLLDALLDFGKRDAPPLKLPNKLQSRGIWLSADFQSVADVLDHVILKPVVELYKSVRRVLEIRRRDWIFHRLYKPL